MIHGLQALIVLGVFLLVLVIVVGVGAEVITQFNATTGAIPKPVGNLLTTLSNFVPVIVLVILGAVVISLITGLFTAGGQR